MILQSVSSWILFNVAKDIPCQNSYCWVYPEAPFLEMAKICPFMAKTWSSHDPSIWILLVTLIDSSLILIIVPRDLSCQISHCVVYPLALFPRNGKNMALLWPKHGPSNWFFLNKNQCAQECSKPNFTNLGVSKSSLFIEMAKIWPFYGQNMVLTWSSKLVLPES